MGVPSPTELFVLADFERGCTREVEELEEKGKLITNTILELLQDLLNNGRELKTRRAQIEICRSFRAPIHLLPPEILSRIFQLALPKNRKTSWTHPPQVLLRVCKAWEKVAESEPTLWNVFRYRFRFPPLEKHFHNMDKSLNKYSVRAAGIPLTIEILGDNGRPEAIDMLSDHFPRCISFSLSIESSWFLGYIALLPSFSLSNMESLSIRFNNNFNIEVLDSFQHRFEAFSNASKLTKLKLNATPIHVKKIRIPFHQLSEFSYSARVPFSALDGESSVEALRWLMKKSLKLHTLDVYLHGIGQKIFDICEETLVLASQESSDITSFDSLTTITFRAGFRTSFNFVFRHFHFPALSSLRMVATGRPVGLLIPLPTNFSEEPTVRLPFLSHLTSLSLIRIEIHPDDLLTLLGSTPLLSSLDVMLGEFLSINNFIVSDQALVEGLIISDLHEASDSQIVPHLQDLRLYYADGDDDESSLYAKLALSRFNWANNCPGGRDLSAQRREAGLAYYPFRLYLKFERDLWPLHEQVADEIGPLHSKIYHPEKSYSFLKEV